MLYSINHPLFPKTVTTAGWEPHEAEKAGDNMKRCSFKGSWSLASYKVKFFFFQSIDRFGRSSMPVIHPSRGAL